MAGHSKFKNIQYRKGAQDKKRAKQFAKIGREIQIAVKIGGTDPESNPRLRLAITNARSVNMPKDNVDRAINKNNTEASDYSEVRYEGYGPFGTAFIVEALTDNKNRTISNVRSIFEKNSCSLGSEGSVSYQFSKLGLFKIKNTSHTEEEIFNLLSDSGAENIENINGCYEITTPSEKFNLLREIVESNFEEIYYSGLIWRPKNFIKIENKEIFTILDNFNSQLEDDDDVQNIFSNAKIDKKLKMDI